MKYAFLVLLFLTGCGLFVKVDKPDFDIPLEILEFRDMCTDPICLSHFELELDGSEMKRAWYVLRNEDTCEMQVKPYTTDCQFVGDKGQCEDIEMEFSDVAVEGLGKGIGRVRVQAKSSAYPTIYRFQLHFEGYCDDVIVFDETRDMNVVIT